MGRPLNKKYFGNRNIGTTGSGDNAMGGEGVGSVTITNEGSYTSALPTVSFSTPDLSGIGGVRATGIVHGHALSAATTSNGSGYNFGDTLTVVGGTSTSAATFTVASTLVVSAVKSNGGSGYNDGDLLTFSTGFSPSLILRVNRPGGGTGTPDNFTINQAGRRTSANPTNPVAYDSRTGTGTGCTVTLTFGVYSFSAVAVQGDYTVMPSNPASFTGGAGTGAAATITFGVSGIVMTEKGSGYSTPADAAVTFSTGAAAGTSVLTTDSGSYGNAGKDGSNMNSGNQENALVIYADTDDNGSKIGDIIKQVSTRRFKVRTADGTAICSLKSTAVSAEGDMTLNATDASGKTYYVTKINNHRATVVPYGTTGHEFPLLAGQPQIVPWTMNATSGTKVYDVQPYLQTGVNVKVDNE